jgi:hypothetical protein
MLLEIGEFQLSKDHFPPLTKVAQKEIRSLKRYLTSKTLAMD